MGSQRHGRVLPLTRFCRSTSFFLFFCATTATTTTTVTAGEAKHKKEKKEMIQSPPELIICLRADVCCSSSVDVPHLS